MQTIGIYGALISLTLRFDAEMGHLLEEERTDSEELEWRGGSSKSPISKLKRGKEERVLHSCLHFFPPLLQRPQRCDWPLQQRLNFFVSLTVSPSLCCWAIWVIHSDRYIVHSVQFPSRPQRCRHQLLRLLSVFLLLLYSQSFHEIFLAKLVGEKKVVLAAGLDRKRDEKIDARLDHITSITRPTRATISWKQAGYQV